MSYRDLAGTLARIDAVTDQTPVCLRPGCGIPTIPAVSPWCQPECARLTVADRRQRLAGFLEEVRAVRVADELLQDSLDDDDRDLLGRLCARGLTTDDIAPIKVSAWDLLGLDPDAVRPDEATRAAMVQGALDDLDVALTAESRPAWWQRAVQQLRRFTW